MAYKMFRKRPSATQSYNSFQVSSKIATNADGDDKKAEKMLAKAYNRAVQVAAGQGRTVPVLPPADNMWTWNRSLEILLDIAIQSNDDVIGILVPEIADIAVGMNTTVQLADAEIEAALGTLAMSVEDDGDDAFAVLGDMPKKRQWLNGFGGDLEEEMKWAVPPGSKNIPDHVPLPDEGKIVEALFSENPDSFAVHLSNEMEETSLTARVLAQKSNLITTTVVRLRNGEISVPRKGQVLALSIALGLPMEQLKEFIGVAGYTLAPQSVPRDRLVSYYLDNKVYDISRINKALFLYDLPLLGDQ